MKLILGVVRSYQLAAKGKFSKTLHTTFLFVPSINLYNRVSRLG